MSLMETNEPLLAKKSSSYNAKTVCGGLSLVVLMVGAIGVYSLTGQQENSSSSSSSPISRVISGEVNVKELSPMKSEWSYFNDYTLELQQLSLYSLSGKLVQASSHETTFTVDYHTRVLTLSRKDTTTNEVTETLYTTQGETLSSDTTAPIYQYSNKGAISDGLAGFENFISSNLVTDTYIISLKLAQYGFTGKSAPVIKGFHTVAQTLARQKKGFTEEMRTVVKEINAKMKEEKNKNEEASLLWKSQHTASFQEKLRYGPCDRYEDCTCEIENRSSTCGNACYGLCGTDCTCWEFVCGDCTCHCFCYAHDNYCSCYSMADLHCWNIWLWFDACC